LGAQPINAEELSALNLNTEVLNFNNDKTDIKPIIDTSNGEIKVTVPKPENQFRPGKYTLKVGMMENEKVVTSSKGIYLGRARHQYR